MSPDIVSTKEDLNLCKECGFRLGEHDLVMWWEATISALLDMYWYHRCCAGLWVIWQQTTMLSVSTSRAYWMDAEWRTMSNHILRVKLQSCQVMWQASRQTLLLICPWWVTSFLSAWLAASYRSFCCSIHCIATKLLQAQVNGLIPMLNVFFSDMDDMKNRCRLPSPLLKKKCLTIHTARRQLRNQGEIMAVWIQVNLLVTARISWILLCPKLHLPTWVVAWRKTYVTWKICTCRLVTQSYEDWSQWKSKWPKAMQWLPLQQGTTNPADQVSIILHYSCNDEMCADSIFNSPDTIDEIKQYCLYRNEVDEDDAALHFCHLAESQLNRHASVMWPWTFNVELKLLPSISVLELNCQARGIGSAKQSFARWCWPLRLLIAMWCSAFELLIVDGTLSKTRPHKYKVGARVTASLIMHIIIHQGQFYGIVRILPSMSFQNSVLHLKPPVARRKVLT